MATRRRGQLIDGVLLLDKPEGLSSNHALQRARRTLDARKAGHTGTLDPFATGLLVCCFGRATKISATMLEADKAYEATLAFGEETDSGDLTGNVTAQAADFAGVAKDALEAALPAFRGPISQVPPMYSALKRDGKPLYEYARQGIELEREARCVVIHELTVLECTPRSARLYVRCSKGTYIRTLAQDIGRALGCYAHLSALRRTELGPFNIDDAFSLDTLQAMEDPMSALLAIESLPTEILPKKLQSEG
ncbi:tRNA pseudouridine(55) synthase TruB [Alcaligenes sp. WGS1538]|uniref:tRNA pseudouridine(55) synthase TruB n=1 Tax=Alcaligenes sp. WGS1538 TaxID=3366811 RepID=UPI00372D4F69